MCVTKRKFKSVPRTKKTVQVKGDLYQPMFASNKAHEKEEEEEKMDFLYENNIKGICNNHIEQVKTLTCVS